MQRHAGAASREATAVVFGAMTVRFVRFELPVVPSREAPSWRQEACPIYCKCHALQEAEIFESLELDKVFRKDSKHRFVREQTRIRLVRGTHADLQSDHVFSKVVEPQEPMGCGLRCGRPCSSR